MKTVEQINAFASQNNAKYTLNFSTPTRPTMDGNNINNIDVAEIEERIDNYIQQADTYSNTYLTYVKHKRYTVDRLMKDLSLWFALQATNFGAVNRQTNTYIANIKTDNYFNYAKNNSELTSNEEITQLITNMNELIDNFYFYESSAESQSSSWYTGSKLPEQDYDTRALVLHDDDIFGENNIIFINDTPNANETSRTFTAYNESGNKIYTIAYDNRATISETQNGTTTSIENPTYQYWVIKDASQHFVAKIASNEFPAITYYRNGSSINIQDLTLLQENYTPAQQNQD